MPTRRINGFWTAYRSIVETTVGPYELYVAQNPDCLFQVPPEVNRIISPEGPAARSHQMCELARGDVIFGGADDYIWRTHGWDQILLEKAKQHPIGCFYFDDGSSPMNSRIPVVTRGFYEIAGYAQPRFYHFYGDTWLTDIASKAGCLFPVLEVVIEHMHPKFGKAPRDEVYEMRGEPNKRLWEETAQEREEIAQRLKAAIENKNSIRGQWNGDQHLCRTPDGSIKLAGSIRPLGPGS